ncbi:MAG: hypothetical protein ACREDR_36195, partial [Blastocatellia bacterium]
MNWRIILAVVIQAGFGCSSTPAHTATSVRTNPEYSAGICPVRFAGAGVSSEVSSGVSSFQDRKVKTYRDQKTGIEFSYPAGLELTELDPKTERWNPAAVLRLGLRPAGWSNSLEFKRFQDAEYPIDIRVERASLENAAKESGFERSEGVWALDSAGPKPGKAREIGAPGSRVLMGSGYATVPYKDGERAGLIDVMRAIVSNGGGLVIIYDAGPVTLSRNRTVITRSEFERMALSTKFGSTGQAGNWLQSRVDMA